MDGKELEALLANESDSEILRLSYEAGVKNDIEILNALEELEGLRAEQKTNRIALSAVQDVLLEIFRTFIEVYKEKIYAKSSTLQLEC